MYLCSKFCFPRSFLSNQVVTLLMEAMKAYSLWVFSYSSVESQSRKLNKMQVVYHFFLKFAELRLLCKGKNEILTNL